MSSEERMSLEEDCDEVAGVSEEDCDEVAGVSEEEGALIESKKLSSVGYVKVCPPTNRMGEYCYIYGEISINDDRANAPVTIFRRDRHNPQRITLGDDDFSFLALSDHESDRALSAFFRPLLVNLKLYQIDVESSSKEEQGQEQKKKKKKKKKRLIANVEGYEILDDLLNEGRLYLLPGKCGFLFKISYAAIYGARVEVEVKINRPFPEAEEEGATLSGSIVACQIMGEAERNIILYDGVDTPVVFGAPFPLARKLVVAPTRHSAYLSIDIELYDSHSTTLFASGFLPFPVKPGTKPYSFITYKDHTHVKHLPGNLVSVSIKFLDENMPGYWTP